MTTHSHDEGSASKCADLVPGAIPTGPIPPKAAAKPSYIVGIGASAGGLEALERFFKAMPPDSGMAFVVLQHLSPDFKSLMDELLARFTTMAIQRVEGSAELRQNTVHLLSPGMEMFIADGRLMTKGRPKDAALNMPINTFFQSLAREVGEKAIAIVLSGTGTDGTIGLMDVHDMGGLVLAQSQETAKFDGMPRSAIDTGLADAVMAPEEMPAAILAYGQNRALPAVVSKLQRHGEALVGLPAIVQRLRETFDVDFSLYKPATISRRIERRIALNQCDSLDEYSERLNQHPAELESLFKDLLIGVTRFFRDTEAFEILRDQVIGPLVDAAPASEEIRVWVAGCATGEEAYSMGILFLEAYDQRNLAPNVKIFASDLHRDSLAVASDGLYSVASLEEISATRRERFFVQEDSQTYRVHGRLRRLLVFSAHNLIKDPPFTKIDLVSCRNLLIYFQPGAQNKVLGTLHFALKLHGTLFLGPSEGPGELQGEFEILDRPWRLYRKAHDSRLPMELRMNLPVTTARNQRLPIPGDVRLSRAYDTLLNRFVPTGVLVNERRDVLHLFGESDRFLRPQTGRMSSDVVTMARGDLRIALASAIQSALKRSQKVTFKGVRAGETDAPCVIDVTAEPLTDRITSAVFVLVLFQEERPIPVSEPDQVRTFQLGEEAEMRIQQLENELVYTKESLQTTVEELQTSNEELQASNEELQASNEELQSTNEELHSVNEELYSVNAELEQKIKELSETTTDLRNLIQSSEIGTIFTDADRRIRLYTPAAANIFNLLPQDVGRDIQHITSRVHSDDVFQDIDRSFATKTPQVKKVITHDGRSFLRRITPYQDANRLPAGLILTFVDITALDAAERQFQTMVESAPQAIVMVDEAGRVVLANQQAERTFLYEPGEMVGLPLQQLLPERLRESHERQRAGYMTKPETRPMGRDRKLLALRKDGVEIATEIGLSTIRVGGETCVMALITDISDRLVLEAEHRKIEERLQEAARLESLGLLAGGIAHDFNNILTGILGNISLLEKDLVDPRLRRLCEEAHNASLRAGELCRQMLAYSGRGQFVLEHVDLQVLVDDTVRLVRASLDKNLVIHIENSGRPIRLEVDPPQIRQVLMNLIINAGEAMEGRPGAIRIRLGVARLSPDEASSMRVAPAEPRGEFTFVEVSDDGVGIGTDNLKRIFDPFYTTKFAGRGLGLAAVTGIVRGHKGGLSVKSVIGQGTTFTLHLPVTEEGVLADPPVSAPILRSDNWPPNSRVLVVDDEDSVRMAIVSILTRFGLEAVPVASGREAISTFAENPASFDLVVLDLTMPGIDGAAAFRELCRIRPTVRVLLISGYSVNESSMRYAGLGIAGFLQKPFGVSAFRDAMRSVFNRMPG
jgi:two-component system CheB/CheR fusion protein